MRGHGRPSQVPPCERQRGLGSSRSVLARQQRGSLWSRVIRARADLGSMTEPGRFAINQGERGCRRPCEPRTSGSPCARNSPPRVGSSTWIIRRAIERSSETRAWMSPLGPSRVGESALSRSESYMGSSEAHQGQFLSAHVGSKPEGTDLLPLELATRKTARRPSPVYRNSAKAVGQFWPIEACRRPHTPRCR